jgi:hypothetical protein
MVGCERLMAMKDSVNDTAAPALAFAVHHAPFAFF